MQKYDAWKNCSLSIYRFVSIKEINKETMTVFFPFDKESQHNITLSLEELDIYKDHFSDYFFHLNSARYFCKKLGYHGRLIGSKISDDRVEWTLYCFHVYEWMIDGGRV
jgi:hypothetical protein